jgi:hypothetical protein
MIAEAYRIALGVAALTLAVRLIGVWAYGVLPAIPVIVLSIADLCERKLPK